MPNTTKNRTFFVTIMTMLLATGLAIMSIPTVAHAQLVGEVCLAPAGASSCPSSPPVIRGSMGSQVRVAVFTQNSAALNGFEITVLADHTILKPAGADLTGSVLGTQILTLIDCIGGVPTGGESCTAIPGVDNADTISVGAVAVPGPTSSPTTGLLFTAIYNVVAETPSTPIGYQTGCSGFSVTGTTTCVQVVLVTVVPETVQTASFTSFTLSLVAGPNSLMIPQKSSATSTLTVMSVNGFSGAVTLSTSVSPVVRHGPAVSLSLQTLVLSPGSSSTSILTISTKNITPIGGYTVIVVASSGTVSKSVQITVNVTP